MQILQDKSASEPISDGLLYAILVEHPRANDVMDSLYKLSLCCDFPLVFPATAANQRQ